LWKINNYEYYIDAPYHDHHNNNGHNNGQESAILQHLHQYKLRRTEVTIEHYNCNDTKNNICRSHVLFGTLESGMDACPPGYISGLDPRHPSLGVRILQLPEAIHNGLPSLQELVSKQFSNVTTSTATSNDDDDNNNNNPNDGPNESSSMRGNYNLLRRLAGIAEGSELTGRIALESNQELLNAISFDKGCYLGQELTARVFHTGVIRKRIMPLLLLESQSAIPQPWIVASQLQEQRLAKKFSIHELQALPSRLPRLSVAAAGQLVAITTASIEPSQPSVDAEAANELYKAQVKVTEWLQKEVDVACQPSNGTDGAKIIDTETGTTIGQIVAPPMKGTNLILALMRLESVGLIHGGTWSKTNKVTINGKQFRYLPYLPLWWPELSMSTGKAKRDDEDYSDEARSPDENDPVIPTNDSNNNVSTGSKYLPG
jgi:folate-binding protein YgfZ